MTSRYRAPFHPGGSSPIDEDLARKLLEVALAAGGEYADLYFEYRAAGGLGYEEGILKTANRGVTMGMGVRVQRGDSTGYAYCEDLDFDAMKAAAKTAAQIASGGDAPPVAVPSRRALPKRYEVEGTSLDVSGAKKRELLQRADRAARAYDSRIKRVEASFFEEIREILVATSEGIFVHDHQPLMRFGVRVIAEDGKLRQAGSSGGGGRIGMEYFLQSGKKPEDQGREAARIAIAMLHAKDAPAGELPVVLAPGDSGILLHEAVGHGLEADFNRKKTSNYTDQVGKLVASELVTVVDDPTYAHARGSINVDDEGRDAVPVTLIEGGTLRGYMQDRHSARHFQTASGNGRRESFRSAPMPRMTNTVMLGGPHGAEEIIASVKKGIFAKRFSGGQVNISNGDFVFSLTESYLIEDGKLTAPLKGVNLIGNGPDVLRKVDMLGADVELSDGIWTCGKDGQSVPVGVGCPTTRISAITVGGTKVGG
ncbi:metallopeptidase TldD-related protein [Myxococcota bacterium]|nr:metallopeptidase TldD-related protein [Myxococcota bacterium]